MHYEDNITKMVKAIDRTDRTTYVFEYANEEAPKGYYLSSVGNVYGEEVELTFSPLPTPDYHRKPFDFTMYPFGGIAVDDEGRSYVYSACSCGGCYWNRNYIVDGDSFTGWRHYYLLHIFGDAHLKNIKISCGKIHMKKRVKLTNVEIIGCEWLQVGEELIPTKDIDEYFKSISV